MPRLETVINPPIRGAARTMDLAMPQPNVESVGNTAIGTTWVNRQGVTLWSQGSVTGFGVPPAGTGWTTYRGRVAFRQTGSGTSGGFYKSGSNFAIYFPQTRAGIGGFFNDDFRCWRVVAILAFDGSGLGSGDIGLEVTPPANYDMVVGTTLGYRLGPTAAGSISLQIRQNGGGPLTHNAVVASVDVNDWHAYEMRFVGATATEDGTFKAFIDGVPVGSFGYGAGTILPGFVNGAALGYTISFGNRGATNTYVCKCGIQVAASATEGGLL